MNSSKIVPDDAKAEFWAVVTGCLREFHQMKPAVIRRETEKRRNAVEKMTTGELEAFYHSEPFDIACEIAHRPLSLDECLVRYLRIRDEDNGTGISTQKIQIRREANAKG